MISKHIPQCIIVDDEPLAADILERYISQLDTLSLAGRFENAIAATLFLQKHKIDILFLDIQMPKLNGIDFLKTLSNRPAVIFTTAFREYAWQGFELNVLDYLVKPVSFERFLAAINKYHAAQGNTNVLPPAIMENESVSRDSFIYLKADKKMVRVLFKDILYIESLRDYVKVKTIEKEIITYQRITSLEEKLPETMFLRIHRSYIIAINHIRSFNASVIGIANTELPIGRLYKASVMKTLGLKS